jgi:hypothetical protein
MSDRDLELLVTLDDPRYEPEEDWFDHHPDINGTVAPIVDQL